MYCFEDMFEVLFYMSFEVFAASLDYQFQMFRRIMVPASSGSTGFIISDLIVVVTVEQNSLTSQSRMFRSP
jgi:hypothetical protein